MISPEELADSRQVATDGLDGLCDVLRMVRVVQPNHSWSEEEQTISSAVPCRKVPTTRAPEELLALSGQQQNNRLITTFRLPATATVYGDDVLLYNGKRYPVAGVGIRTSQVYLHVFAYDDSRP